MNFITETEQKMQKCLQALKGELTKLRTGRAHPSLLDNIKVSYYGTDTPLSQVASIVVTDSQTLTITPWEKNLIGAIDKALRIGELGLNPVTTGDNIRVPLPPLTEERRRDLVKIIKSEAENSKVSIRNIRRDTNSKIKEALKDKVITEDEERKEQDNIQKLTNQYIKQIDEMITTKENDLMAM